MLHVLTCMNSSAVNSRLCIESTRTQTGIGSFYIRIWLCDSGIFYCLHLLSFARCFPVSLWYYSTYYCVMQQTPVYKSFVTTAGSWNNISNTSHIIYEYILVRLTNFCGIQNSLALLNTRCTLGKLRWSPLELNALDYK